MKKVLSIGFLLVIVVFSIFSMDADSIKKVQSLAPYFGLPEDFSFIENPTTVEDYENNIIFYALLGDYSPVFSFSSKEEMQKIKSGLFDKNYFYSLRDGGKWHSRLDSLTATYGDIFGYIINSEVEPVSRKKKGIWTLTYNITCNDLNHYPNGIPTEEEYYNQFIEGVEKTIEFDQLLHENGTINDSMTDFEKLKKIHKASTNLGNKKVRENNKSDKYKLVKVDNLFSYIGVYNTNCVGTASYFAVIMRMEGVKAQTYFVEGHVITRLILDGSEILFDNYSDELFYHSDAEYEQLKQHGGIKYGRGTRLLF